MRGLRLVELSAPYRVPTSIAGIDLLVTHVGRGQSGIPRAQVSVWNGELLCTDILEPAVLAQRQRFGRAVSGEHPDDIPDPALIVNALLAVSHAMGSILADGADLDDGAARDQAEPQRVPSASFAGLVDLVQTDDGQPMFLVLEQAAQGGLAVVEEYEDAQAASDDPRILVPPPLPAIPWRLPRASEVLGWAAPGADDPRQLYEDITACLKAHGQLPVLKHADYPDAYYDLETAFTFHTHYLEPAAYSPVLALVGPVERGKSRNGRTNIYLSRRGIHTETLREANLFRDSQDRAATLFLDATSLWKKAQQLGCEDILLNRFERGAKVSRVLYPERGPFEDTKYFDIFGPTILASNEPLGRILDTRCIPIPMPLAPDGVEYPVPNEAELLPLRERLTAWRARQMLAGWMPAPLPKPAGSRLGDVLLPLAQIVAAVASDRLPAFRALAAHLERARRQERALSWEAAVISAVVELRDEVKGGLLLVAVIANRVNIGRPEKEALTNRQVGDVLRLLGLTTKKGHANKAALVWDEAAIGRLASHYADRETDAEEIPDVSPGIANHANQANPQASETASDEASAADWVSKVSKVSYPGGHTEDFSDRTPAADPVPGDAASATPRHPAEPEGLFSRDDTTPPAGDDVARVADVARLHTQSHPPENFSRVELITESSRWQEILPGLLQEPLLAVDCETTGLDARSHRLRLVQVATREQVSVVDLFRMPAEPLAPLLANARRLVFHNAKFDLAHLRAAGLPTPDGSRLLDTMVGSQILAAGTRFGYLNQSGLGAVVPRYLGEELDKSEQRSDWTADLSDAQIRYAARDAAILLPLADQLDHELDAAGLTRVGNLEMRCLPAIGWLEQSGAPFDAGAWADLSDAAVAAQLQLEAQLTELAAAGDLFGASVVNWRSPAQVAKLLQARGHAVVRTDEATLRALVGIDPLAPLLLQYREAARKASAYGIEYLRFVHPGTGRIHADYLQLGAASGRMSCTRPNLQNVPRDPAYRRCFRAPDGRVLIKADYSQIELRVIAELTGDERMREAYQRGEDLHEVTAAAILGRTNGQVRPADRQAAKALNFGLAFGMGARRLREHAASDYGVHLSEDEAAAFRRRFFDTYPGLARWHRSQPDGEMDTRTIAGRRRLGVKSFTEKLNSPVQGSASDGMKAALALLWETRSRCPSACPVLTVHDEIVVEVDCVEVEAARTWLVDAMERGMAAFLKQVPVVVETKVGSNWSMEA